MIGLSAGGEGLPCLTLNSPDCARHKTPSVSMREGERERESEGGGAWRRRRRRRREEGATGEKSGFMMSGRICVLTSRVIAASLVL